jgi:hypothetical protein
MPQKREPYFVRALSRLRPLRSFWLSRAGADKAIEGTSKAYAKAKHKAEEVWKKWRPKSVLDVLIYICGTLAVLGSLWLGYLGVSGHLKNQQSFGLWILYATITLVLTGVFLHFQKLIWEGSAKAEAAAQHKGAAPHSTISAAERPYLYFKFFRLLDSLTAGKRTVFQASITNSGRAPATGSFTDITWGTKFTPLAGPLMYSPSGTHEFSLAPDEVLTLTFDIDFVPTEEQIKALDAKQLFLFVWARGEYTDEAGRTYPFPFCYRYDKQVPGEMAICNPEREHEKGAKTPIIGNVVLIKPLAANKIVEVNLVLLNDSGDAAENLTGEFGFVYRNDASIPESNLCAPGTTFGPINLSAHAQVPILVRGLTPLPAAELAAIEKGKEWLFFCGQGSYKGVGGQVLFEFCSVYWVEGKGFINCFDPRNPYNQK